MSNNKISTSTEPKNILKDWKKYFFYESSDFHPKKWCRREDIDKVETILLDFYGESFFIESKNSRKRTDNEAHLVEFLLCQRTDASLVSLYHHANLLEYSMTLEPHIIKKLKSNINNAEQFQNILFEIYTCHLLDYNKIENEKSPMKGSQELDGTCILNGKSFLFECRKSYSAAKSIFKDIKDILESFYAFARKMKGGSEFIGYVKIKEYGGASKQELTQIFKQYFGQVGKNGICIEYECKHLKLETKLYNQENLAEYNSIDENDLIKFRCYTQREYAKGDKTLYGIEVSPQFSISQDKVMKKLMKTVRDKRKQHKECKDKIIFIDAELNHSLNFPLLMNDNMIDEEKLNKYLESKDTNDIVAIIMRDYTRTKPTIKIKVFGKEELSKEKLILENLKTDFNIKVEPRQKRRSFSQYLM